MSANQPETGEKRPENPEKEPLNDNKKPQNEKTSDDYVLVNITEQVVLKKAREMMEEYDMCCCNKCFCDVCAIALQRLPAQYATTRRGELLEMVEASRLQYKTSLVVSILRAISKVKDSPQHG